MVTKRTLLTTLLLLTLATASQASSGERNPSMNQFDFWGFSIAPEPANLGEELTLIGVVNEATTNVPPALDFANYEYTVYISGLRLAQIVPSGQAVVHYYSGGEAEIYEDRSFNAPFQATTDPDLVPDLDPTEVPANFKDGTLLVRFAYRNCITIFYPSFGIGTIAYTATELRAVGGSSLGILRGMRMTVGWHMGGGYTNDAGAFIPAGYGMRYDTLFRWENPLPVRQTTWGNIKAAFK